MHNYLVICVNYIVAYSLEILFPLSFQWSSNNLVHEELAEIFVCLWLKKISL